MSKVSDYRIDEQEIVSVERALGLLEGKWKCLILFQLLGGTARFSELRRGLPWVTQRTLTNQLRDLERDGLIDRKIYAQVPIRVDYTISPLGLTLEPILRALQGWGRSHRERLSAEHPVMNSHSDKHRTAAESRSAADCA